MKSDSQFKLGLETPEAFSPPSPLDVVVLCPGIAHFYSVPYPGPFYSVPYPGPFYSVPYPGPFYSVPYPGPFYSVPYPGPFYSVPYPGPFYSVPYPGPFYSVPYPGPIPICDDTARLSRIHTKKIERTCHRGSQREKFSID